MKVLLFSGGLDSYITAKIMNPDICLYIDINSKYYDAYMFQGRQYHFLDNYDKALEVYNQAVKIEPDNYRAYFEIAWLYKFKKNYDKYISFLQKAAKLDDVRAQKSLKEKGISWEE